MLRLCRLCFVFLSNLFPSTDLGDSSRYSNENLEAEDPTRASLRTSQFSTTALQFDEVHVLSDEGNRQVPLFSRWDVRTRRVSSRESACSGTPAPGTHRFGEPAPVSPQLVTPQSNQIHSQCPAVTLPQAGPESDSQQLTRRWDFTQGEVCSREFACSGVPFLGRPR